MGNDGIRTPKTPANPIIDVAAAETRIEETAAGSLDDLTDTHEEFERALTGPLVGSETPQSHQMLGHATIQGGLDCRNEAVTAAASRGYAGLSDPDQWIVLVQLRAGSATDRVFWDAHDLVIMAPAADVAAGRWDRCVLLAG